MFRPLTINAVLNGWIVTCGCQTVVYQDRNQLVSDLNAYLQDPHATEARFLKTGVNQGLLGGVAPPLMADTASEIPTRSSDHYRAMSSRAENEVGKAVIGRG